MQQLEKTIKKIGQFTYFFTDMDTIFIDKDSNIIWEYGLINCQKHWSHI